MVVTRLLGRAPSGRFSVALRRADGTPAVIVNSPLLDDGTPMPTRYWLVDPEVRAAVSRLEAAGGVRSARSVVDPGELEAAHARYAAERDAAIAPGHLGPRPSGGVGGTREGVKCLHAHVAWFLAGGDDPVGRWVGEQLGVRREDFVREPRAGSVAAIDCGTNSTRLLVVGADGAALDRQMRITRLGEGVDATGMLSPKAIGRTVAVLEEYRRSMDSHAVTRARIAATSATRDASNSEDFFSAAEAATGIRPELLSGDEEGRLAFAGATSNLPERWRDGEALLVADVGGGSTELVVGVPGRSPAPEVCALSLDIGCVRVSERFLGHDPPDAGELAEARDFVTSELATARAQLSPLPAGGPVVGLAGTVSTLAALEVGAVVYDRSLVHHFVLGRAKVESWLERLSGEDMEARLARPGMVAGREDVIVGGVVVLAAVMEVFERDVCLVSEDDILDGLAASLMQDPRS
ncbi:MAG TPA: DUF501 domain-containing protein [Acidimicrobiales bacterium]|nr:DUF501 domain-containing protein [Acidimicrobiales bacterium]